MVERKKRVRRTPEQRIADLEKNRQSFWNVRKPRLPRLKLRKNG
jgi:hypothetical protein